MKNDDVLGCTLVIFGLVGVVIVSSIISGFVFSTLWGWFVVPVFFLPTLSIPQAIGIGVLISFLTKQHIPTGDQSSGEVISNLIIQTLVLPSLALAIGWVILRFM